MVWIDQPVGTGFSPAAEGVPATIKNEKDVAEDFMGFWKNFMETFDLVGRKVYLTGTSSHYLSEISPTHTQRARWMDARREALLGKRA